MSRNDDVEDALDVDVLVDEFFGKHKDKLPALLEDARQLELSITLFLHDRGLGTAALGRATQVIMRDVTSAAEARQIIENTVAARGGWDRTTVGTDPHGNHVVVGHIPRRSNASKRDRQLPRGDREDQEMTG